MATALFPVTIIRWIHCSPTADRGVIIIRNLNQQFKVKSQSKQSDFKSRILHFLPPHFECVPLFACRDAALDPENWVHIPLKEISDANKLFCALCSGYRVAPKTKLCVTLLTSTKFASPSSQDAPSSAGMAHPRSAYDAGQARKKTRGHRGGAETQQQQQHRAWVRILSITNSFTKIVSCGIFNGAATNTHCLLLLGYFIANCHLAYIQHPSDTHLDYFVIINAIHGGLKLGCETPFAFMYLFDAKL